VPPGRAQHLGALLAKNQRNRLGELQNARRRGEIPSSDRSNMTAKPSKNGKKSADTRFQPGHPGGPGRHADPATMERALQLQSGAVVKRAVGQSMREGGDHTGAYWELAEAEQMESEAHSFINDVALHVTGPVQTGNGGELIVATREAAASIPGVIDTVRQSPDMLAATASRARLELTGNALTLAVDTAQSIQPKNNIEKMLAHELAAAHRLAMLFVNKSADIVDRTGGLSQFQSVEASRLANAAARMMGAFQDGMRALERTRRGGRQTVRVVHQHVAVGPGGQAVVAGTVKGNGPRGKSAGGKRRNDQ
jgi:hypothetical protein